MGLKDSAKAAGYPVTHSTVKRILTRKYYLGDSFYPQIIDENTYLQAKNEIDRRAEHFNCCGRTRRKKPVIYTDFEMGNPTESFENPSEQAEYLYSLIEVKLWQT